MGISFHFYSIYRFRNLQDSVMIYFNYLIYLFIYLIYLVIYCQKYRACSSALNRIRLRTIFLHRAFQRLYRNRLTLHQPPLVEENLNRSPSRLGPVDGSCGAANTNFCKQLLGYSRVSAAEELRGRGC